jgi:DNA mismatch endonuclease (patch repair protein)
MKSILPTEQISKRMRMVRSKDTSLERNMETILNSMSLKYIKQPPLEGRPDFKIKDTNVLIFCDSSFWHGRNKKETSGRAFKVNKAFWVRKLTGNKSRDKRINLELKKSGWMVLRFWDDDILKRPKRVKKSIKGALNAKG